MSAQSPQPASEPASYATGLHAWWMVVVFCIAGFVSYAHRLVLSVLVEPMRADLGIGDSSVSLLQGAAFAIIYVFAGLPLGRLADRRARRAILLGGAAVWCLGTVLCGLADSFWLLFGARAIVGIGEAALAPAAASMIGDTFPPHRRGTAFGLFFMGMVVGGPAAIAIGGLLFGAAQAGAFASWPLLGSLAPWRTVLVLIGAGGFIVPLLFLTLKEPQRREPVSHVPLSIVASRFWVERRLLLPILLGVALLSVGDYGLLSWVPATLSRVFGWTPEQVGPPFGLITAAAGISGALLGGVLSDFALAKGGTRARFTLCAVAAALGAVGAGLICTTTSGLVLAGLGLWTFASAVGATAGIAALQDAVPSGFRGIGMSLVAFCNTLLGLGLGPTIVALVTERGFGYPGAVGFSISLVVVPAAIVSALLLFACSRMIARARGTVAHG